MRSTRLSFAAALVLSLGAFTGVTRHAAADRFDHEKHRLVFPECRGCHVGIVKAGQSVFPSPAVCANCHDGTVQRQVDYAPPPPRASNLHYTHPDHVRWSGRPLVGDSALPCGTCHIPTGAPWMTVRRPIPDQCFGCHRIRGPHLSAPDTACGTCHYTLAQAVSLPESRIAKFPAPPSHLDSTWRLAAGHGRQAAGSTRSCAVCHAREFCMQCHVNAPEIKPIQSLASDPRSLAIRAELRPPASHQDERFASRHGTMAQQDLSRCAFCHTQESCVACHRFPPPVVLRLPAAGPGRGVGARIDRATSAPHFADFADRHDALASARPALCGACHARAECLACHRPSTAAVGSYHPIGFLTRHPVAAWNRQNECATCHNQAAFCVTCHQQAGLTSHGPLQSGYHDANGKFGLNHGTAARQNIETCVACHSERDCLVCHSAQAGRRFDPHGPGFDADRLRKKNPQTCAACHGSNIPGG